MQVRYYLSKSGSQVGPYTKEEVLAHLKSGDHEWTDYLWDEKKNDWVLLMEHPQFSELFSQGFARFVSKKVTSLDGASEKLKQKAWYTLKDGNNYGPFSQLEIVQMLQEKSLFEHDFIWKADFPQWKHVSEVEEFKPEGIKSLKESGHQEVSEYFFRRRHLRAQYGCSVIVHNNKSVFKGASLEISAGGAGVEIHHPHLEPGQHLFLHFKPGDGVPPFNAICVIVNRSVVNKNSPDETWKYGVKFLKISQHVKSSIKEYTAQKVA